MERKKTRAVKIGNLVIGNNNPIRVQSMCNTKTKNTKATIKQILDLEEAGCEIIRVAVPDLDSARSLKEIKKEINIPLVADIHFNYRLAVESAKYADKIRINPGNIGSEEKIKAVVNAVKENNLPIRIGINAGSLERDLSKLPQEQAMVESALRHIKILEDMEFENIVVSLKSSDVNTTIKAYQLISEKIDYPLHLGVTETGSVFQGIIKSSIGMGSLLIQGIGDTIRVSLTTNDLKEEVKTGYEILKALNLRKYGINLISCPTCARKEIDVVELTRKVAKVTENIKKPLTVAIMGCIVNGPGEAGHADLAVVGSKGINLIYKKGEIIKKVKDNEILDALLKEIEKWELQS